MTERKWFHLVGINPEPWTAPQVGGRRKNGSPVVYKAEGLRVYQEAIKDALSEQESVDYERISLTFYFWRRLDASERQNTRKHRAHIVDATNMQKALEDALQGVLFTNDRNVVAVSSYVCEQGPDVTPRIIICLRQADPVGPIFHEWPIEPIVNKPFGGIAIKEFVPPTVEEYF